MKGVGLKLVFAPKRLQADAPQLLAVVENRESMRVVKQLHGNVLGTLENVEHVLLAAEHRVFAVDGEDLCVKGINEN